MRARTRLSPSRNTAWASTTSTRISNPPADVTIRARRSGHVHEHPGSLMSAAHAHPATQRPSALVHAGDAVGVGRTLVLGLDTAAVVGDFADDVIAAHALPDDQVRSVGVPDGIGQGFLYDAEQGGRSLWRELVGKSLES